MKAPRYRPAHSRAGRLFDLALEEIVGRLCCMNRSDQPKFIHLLRRKIAYANRADLALLEERGHSVGGLFNRSRRIRPVHLVDVDDLSPEPSQRGFDLGEDSLT